MKTFSQSVVLSSLLVSLFSLSAFATSLTEGNYKPLAGERSCDIHIEVNQQAKKVFMTYIANQRTRIKCNEMGKTEIFLCDELDHCVLGSESLEIINERNFISVGSEVKWVFNDNLAVKPASKYDGGGWFGFMAERGSSFSGQSRCAFHPPEGYIYCDDENYAQNVFCPKAEKTSVESAIKDCESNTGKSCYISKKNSEVGRSSSNGTYDQSFAGYTYYASLYCTVKVTAEPRN